MTPKPSTDDEVTTDPAYWKLRADLLRPEWDAWRADPQPPESVRDFAERITRTSVD